MLVLVVFNLALKGLGAPFVMAPHRTDWLNAWTRNPMVLSAFAFRPRSKARELETRFRETCKNQTPLFFSFRTRKMP
jgi:hypothetical protein